MRHTKLSLVTGVQTCALPICLSYACGCQPGMTVESKPQNETPVSASNKTQIRFPQRKQREGTPIRTGTAPHLLHHLRRPRVRDRRAVGLNSSVHSGVGVSGVRGVGGCSGFVGGGHGSEERVGGKGGG